MTTLNRVFLAGTLTRDPVVKQTPSGQSVADLGLAVNERFRRQDGEVVESTCFVDVEAWVADGLEVQRARVVVDRGGEVGRIRPVDELHVDAELGDDELEPGARAVAFLAEAREHAAHRQ